MDTGGGEAQVDHGTSLSVYYNEYFTGGGEGGGEDAQMLDDDDMLVGNREYLESELPSWSES